MVIEAFTTRKRPRWYLKRTMRRFRRVLDRNPGFHRLVITFDDAPPFQAPHLVDPACEAELRHVLSRVVWLKPPVIDDDPWVAL